MIRIGILGDIGSGKSYVAKRFGYPLFNADEEDRERLIYTSPAKPMAQKGREQLPVTNFDQEAEQPSYGEEENQ